MYVQVMGNLVFFPPPPSIIFSIVNRKLLRREPVLSMYGVNAELPKDDV